MLVGIGLVWKCRRVMIWVSSPLLQPITLCPWSSRDVWLLSAPQKKQIWPKAHRTRLDWDSPDPVGDGESWGVLICLARFRRASLSHLSVAVTQYLSDPSLRPSPSGSRPRYPGAVITMTTPRPPYKEVGSRPNLQHAAFNPLPFNRKRDGCRNLRISCRSAAAPRCRLCPTIRQRHPPPSAKPSRPLVLWQYYPKITVSPTAYYRDACISIRHDVRQSMAWIRKVHP